VLVVTHLAQIAAFADNHFFVEKVERKGRTFTMLSKLQSAERERELARMLTGTITDASVANARELLTVASIC
jgi:DNA repair protein RecN (Recombination protein N)